MISHCDSHQFCVSSPVGEVDWNIGHKHLKPLRFLCLPLWGKWIEINVRYLNIRGWRCLPLWGKWIEIYIGIHTFRRDGCLPLWGKWIEMSLTNWKRWYWIVSSPVGEVDWNNTKLQATLQAELCLPLWGKWIEINMTEWKNYWTCCVFPCGGSGLKYHSIPNHLTGNSVFPCGGSGLKYFFVIFSVRLHYVSSPVGEVDWNSNNSFSSCSKSCVFPCGGSGLKFDVIECRLKG